MELWVGPVIVAAAVSGFMSVVGWFVTSWQAIRLEHRRRKERVHDFQVALRAEIASDRLGFVFADNDALLRDVASRYRSDPAYRPIVPHLASNVVFDAIVPEIHVLPGDVIEPVIRYARLHQVLAKFVDDLRAATANGLPAERAVVMFTDYFEMLGRLEARAEAAIAALDVSLQLNRRAADRPNRGSASPPGGDAPAEQDAASTERTDEP